MHSNFMGTTIHIRADFYIDSNFDILGCTVIIEPGLSIIVQSGYGLSIGDYNGIWSHLKACTSVASPEMWYGIRIQGISSTNPGLLGAEFTIIENAEHAVYLEPGHHGFISLQNVIFNENYIHLDFDYSSASTGFSLQPLIENCIFKCDNSLISPHSGITDIAVRFHSLQNNINTIITFGPNNSIENCRIGIFNYYSFFKAINNIIFNTETGIYTEYDCAAFILNNEIYFCGIAVEAKSNFPIVNIIENYIHDISNIGIWFHDGITYDGKIFENEFENIFNPIVIENIPGNFTSPSKVEIGYNRIINSTLLTNSHAIRAIQPIPLDDSFVRILNNRIVNFEQGIFVSQWPGTRILGNHIEVPGQVTPNPGYDIYAIRTENSAGIFLMHNILEGNGDALCDEWFYGMQVEECTDVGIYCNEFGNADNPNPTFNKCLWLGGEHDYSNVAGNKFQFEHTYSLYQYHNMKGLGDQGYSYNVSDNEWNIPSSFCPEYQIFSEQSNFTNLMPGHTTFHVRPNNATEFWWEPNLLFISSDNFPITQITKFQVSSSPNEYTICEYLRPGNAALLNEIANGNLYEQEGVTDAFIWFTDEAYYNYLPTDSVAFAVSELYDYWNELDEGSHGILAEIASRFSDPESGYDISDFEPQTGLEAKIKTVLEMMRFTLIEGIDSLTEGQSDTLETLAALCPISDGPAVYMARNLLNKINGTIINYPAACAGSGERFASGNPFIKGKAFCRVFASPDQIRLFSSPEGNFQIVVYELTGKIIFEKNISGNALINHHLDAGIYLYSLKPENGNAWNGKFAITH